MAKKLHRIAIAVILTSSTLSIMAGAIIAPVLNLIRDMFGLSTASVGLVVTIHALSVAIFSPLFGNIIDRIGPKKPLVFGLLVYGIAGASGVFITSYSMLLLSRAIMGIGIAAFFNAITVTILNLYEGELRNLVMGWRTTAISVGGIIWPIIGGFLGDISYNLPFVIYSIGIVLAVLTIIAVPATPGGKTREKEDKGTIITALKKRPKLIAIYIFMFFLALFLFSIVVFLPQLLPSIGIESPLSISLFISEMMIFAAIASMNYRRIRERNSYKMIILTTLFAWTVGFLLISLAFSAITTAISLALFGLGLGIAMPATMTWAGELVPVSLQGRVLSYLGAITFSGEFLSPVVLAPVDDVLGLKGVFLVVGIASAVLFVVYLMALQDDTKGKT